MNFLVTGGAGFIGYHVCERLLRDGQGVWAFDDLNHFYDPKIKEANLRDLGTLAKPFTFVPRLDRLEARDVPAAFTAGDIVVLRVGDGATYTNTAPIYLDEFTQAGVFVQTINMPTTAGVGVAANRPVDLESTMVNVMCECDVLVERAPGSAQLDGGYPVTGETARQLACDAGLVRKRDLDPRDPIPDTSQ